MSTPSRRRSTTRNVKVQEVLDTFFAGYYHEAAAEMEAYYTTLENYLLAHHIGLRGQCITFPTTSKEAFPPKLVTELQQHLAAAQQAARHGFVKAQR